MPNTLNTAAEQARDALANLAAGKLDVNIDSLMRYAPNSTFSKEAAVLVLFGVLDDEPSASADFDGCPECVGENLDVLLLVRADTLRSHAGQPAFPGGKIDPEDYELARQQGVPVGRIAALREAVEETGLDPAGVEILGGAADPAACRERFQGDPGAGVVGFTHAGWRGRYERVCPDRAGARAGSAQPRQPAYGIREARAHNP